MTSREEFEKETGNRLGYEANESYWKAYALWLENRNKWVSVEDEHPPKDGTLFDVWQKEYFALNKKQDGSISGNGETRKARRLADVYWVENGTDFYGEDRSGFAVFKFNLLQKDTVTHWRPLPTPPDEAKRGRGC